LLAASALAAAFAVPKAPCASGADCHKRCKAGALDACWGLGVIKIEGREGPADEKGALALFKKACDGGFALGCASLSLATDDSAASFALATAESK
jgi:TPR repeat protein